jgi:hypothetical protein
MADARVAGKRAAREEKEGGRIGRSCMAPFGDPGSLQGVFPDEPGLYIDPL